MIDLDHMMPTDCAAFRRATGRQKPTLFHPTNARFRPEMWKIFASEEGVQKADLLLALSAIFLNAQIATIRKRIEEQLPQSFGATDVLRISIAAANLMSIKVKKAYQTGLRQSADEETAGHYSATRDLPPTDATFQSNIDADAVITGTVDALPNWFALAKARAEAGSDRSCEHANWGQVATHLQLFLSVENGLRGLWQQVLWEPWCLVPEVEVKPIFPEAAKLWDVWLARHQGLVMQHAMHDLFYQSIHNITFPHLERTVTGATYRDGVWSIDLNPPSDDQSKRHGVRFSVAQDSYLGPFLELPIPGKEWSFFTLVQAWAVLENLAECLSESIGTFRLNKAAIAEKASFEIERAQLISMLCETLSLSRECANEIISFLSSAPSDLDAMFKRGVWHKPLIETFDRDCLSIVTAPLLYGDVSRLLGLWFQEAGAETRLETSSLGLIYERALRGRCAGAIAQNELLTDTGFAVEGLASHEQIDMIIRIGTKVLVCEIKCFLQPSEPIERFNHLTKIRDAAKQVGRKTDWLKTHLNWLLGALQEPFLCADGLEFVPVIVLNTGFGTGLNVDGVFVTDSHFFQLLLSSGTYVSDGVFNRKDKQLKNMSVQLYRSQQEFEERIEALLADPPVLSKFKHAAEWTTVSWPTAAGGEMALHRVSMSQERLLEKVAIDLSRL